MTSKEFEKIHSQLKREYRFRTDEEFWEIFDKKNIFREFQISRDVFLEVSSQQRP